MAQLSIALYQRGLEPTLCSTEAKFQFKGSAYRTARPTMWDQNHMLQSNFNTNSVQKTKLHIFLNISVSGECSWCCFFRSSVLGWMYFSVVWKLLWPIISGDRGCKREWAKAGIEGRTTGVNCPEYSTCKMTCEAKRTQNFQYRWHYGVPILPISWQ